MESMNMPLKYQLYDDTLRFYNALQSDINAAKSYIYLEFYKFGNDSVGKLFRDLLAKKAREGVEVKVLLDSWGTSLSDSFFASLVQFGGEVRYFEKIRFNLDFLTRSHCRNHRKIVAIDDKVSYIGSANITDYNLVWRELCLRIEGGIAGSFKKIFLQMYEVHNKYVLFKALHTEPFFFGQLEILRDFPSMSRQNIKKRFTKLIKSAKKKIVIESPYFLPSFLVRMALIRAAKRGVKVIVIMPKHSDVRLVDVLRNKYLGPLAERGIEFFMYFPQNLHAKLLLIDDKVFAVGSPNFDYRSFRFQHEIVLTGPDINLSNKLKAHVKETLNDSEPFNYQRWKTRPFIEKVFEWIIVPFRHLL